MADRLRFQPHLEVEVVRLPAFDAAFSHAGGRRLWGSYRRPDGARWIAVAGCVVLSDADWEAAALLPGEGGLVCKALDVRYARQGLAGWSQLSGNYVLLVWDQEASTLHLQTDCTGVFPAYEWSRDGAMLLGSHPDLLAVAAGESDRLDEVSVAEFALTGTVSPPFTYYEGMRAVGPGMVVSIQVLPDGSQTVRHRSWFRLEYGGGHTQRQEDLAEALAQAYRQAVARRSDPRYGRCAVALSGGLDSRAVLASVARPEQVFAFTCYDHENTELLTASAIAAAARVEFEAYRRSSDYYAENAALGVRVAGGMGSLANNHFLGVLPWLRERGVQTLLTGCYCDYLFKGLPLNRRIRPFTGRESLAPFQLDFYFPHCWPDTPLAQAAQARLAARFPPEITRDPSDGAVFEIEKRRIFPLCYEADNAQRLVPQRLTGWFVPVSDPELMRIFCQIPYRWKLNRALFRRVVQSLCGAPYAHIPDANTGARLEATGWRETLAWSRLRLRNRVRRLTASLATEGSWPDWYTYVGRSERLAGLWAQPDEAVGDLFRRILGRERLSPDVLSFQGQEMWLLLQLLTLKLWWRQRA
jgi:asparagine synthase (glutamine-hydrolysing)